MILVTGVAGVIGRALAKRLRIEGVDFVGASRHDIDLTSETPLQSFVPHAPDVIVHLAAAVPHTNRYPDTESSAAQTRTMDIRVFEAASLWGSRVVYASSCINYDHKSVEVKTERSPYGAVPMGPYAMAKHDGEALFAQLPSHAIMRVSAPLGPGLPPTVVAQLFMARSLAGKAIKVWGTGSREQNYVDTRDIADAFVKAAQTQTNGTFNVTADCPTTMLELADATTEVVGSGTVRLSGIVDPREPEYARYSNQHLRSSMGWSPQYSLRQSIQYGIGGSGDS